MKLTPYSLNECIQLTIFARPPFVFKAYISFIVVYFCNQFLFPVIQRLNILIPYSCIIFHAFSFSFSSLVLSIYLIQSISRFYELTSFFFAPDMKLSLLLQAPALFRFGANDRETPLSLRISTEGFTSKSEIVQLTACRWERCYILASTKHVCSVSKKIRLSFSNPKIFLIH